MQMHDSVAWPTVASRRLSALAPLDEILVTMYPARGVDWILEGEQEASTVRSGLLHAAKRLDCSFHISPEAGSGALLHTARR